MIEYAVRRFDDEGQRVHRRRETREACEAWVKEWLDDGGSTRMFYIVWREVSDWEEVVDEPPF